MDTQPRFTNRPPLRSRRVQIGTALGVSALAVVGIIGGAAAWVMNDRSNAAADVADKAKLAIQLQQPKAVGRPNGQIAVLDPSQVQPATTTTEPLTPEMKAMVARDRLDQAKMVADQRAFDSRIRSEIMASYRTDYTPAPSPGPRAQNAPPQPYQPQVRVIQPPQPQLRPIQAPVLTRASDDDGYRTPEDDSDRYQPRPRYRYEDRGYPNDRPYARDWRDWRDRPPPPPPRRPPDDDDEPD